MKKMKFKLLIILLLPLSLGLQAQVTIGSNLPPTRISLLDLKSRQAAGVINTVGDDDNITSKEGGFSLPRVKLVSTITLEPFISTTDNEWTNATKQKALRMSAVGVMVYNIASVGASLYPGLYTWDGEQWSTSQANPSKMEVASGGQPQAFSFYETGLETVQPLIFGISGITGAVTYQWFQVTGTNIHVRVGTPIGQPGTVTGTGSTTASFTPTGVIRTTNSSKSTLYAQNNGFYKFYCEVTDSYGKKIVSDISEVAVGCGAKNNLGEWISFMCFNLGATNNSTIASQISNTIGATSAANTQGEGVHTYTANEENLYGDLFQWGRIAESNTYNGGTNGHEKRQSTAMSFGALSLANDIVNGKRCTNSSGEVGRPWRQVKKTSAWYGKFITDAGAANYNWNPENQNIADYLWRAERFLHNDPCAHYKADGSYQAFWHEGTDQTTIGTTACTDPGTAWRMPSPEEWGAIYKGGTLSGSSATATANTWVWNNTNGRGFEVRPDGKKTTLFLPASGLRYVNNVGTLYYQGSHGYYWSSGVVSTNAYNFFFAAGVVIPANVYSRSAGMAIRCIKNQ